MADNELMISFPPDRKMAAVDSALELDYYEEKHLIFSNGETFVIQTPVAADTRLRERRLHLNLSRIQDESFPTGDLSEVSSSFQLQQAEVEPKQNVPLVTNLDTTSQLDQVQSTIDDESTKENLEASDLLPSERKLETEEILPKAKKISCDFCPYTTSRRSHLNEHTRMIHLKLKTVCDLCGREFSNINQHMRVVHKVLRSGIISKSECEKCHKYFYDLTKHMAKAHSLKYVYEFTCQLCKIKFKSRYSMNRHFTRKHTKKGECGECGKKVVNLSNHISKVHQNKPIVITCPLCCRVFKKKKALDKHLAFCSEKHTNQILVNSSMDTEYTAIQGKQSVASFPIISTKTDDSFSLVSTTASKPAVVDNSSRQLVKPEFESLKFEGEVGELKPSLVIDDVVGENVKREPDLAEPPFSIKNTEPAQSLSESTAVITSTAFESTVDSSVDVSTDKSKLNPETGSLLQCTDPIYSSLKVEKLEVLLSVEDEDDTDPINFGSPLLFPALAQDTPFKTLSNKENYFDFQPRFDQLNFLESDNQNFMECTGLDEEVMDEVKRFAKSKGKNNRMTMCRKCPGQKLVKNIEKHNEKFHTEKPKKFKEAARYQCELCGYKTDRNTNYNMHVKTVHLKARTVCHLCGKEYSNINQHMRVIHKITKSGIKEKNECGLCGHSFYDLKQHLRRAHQVMDQPEKSTTCEVCNEKFTKYYNMLRHIKRIHQGIRESCNICWKEVSNIGKHRKTHKDVILSVPGMPSVTAGSITQLVINNPDQVPTELLPVTGPAAQFPVVQLVGPGTEIPGGQLVRSGGPITNSTVQLITTPGSEASASLQLDSHHAIHIVSSGTPGTDFHMVEPGSSSPTVQLPQSSMETTISQSSVHTQGSHFVQTTLGHVISHPAIHIQDSHVQTTMGEVMSQTPVQIQDSHVQASIGQVISQAPMNLQDSHVQTSIGQVLSQAPVQLHDSAVQASVGHVITNPAVHVSSQPAVHHPDSAVKTSLLESSSLPVYMTSSLASQPSLDSVLQSSMELNGSRKCVGLPVHLVSSASTGLTAHPACTSVGLGVLSEHTSSSADSRIELVSDSIGNPPVSSHSTEFTSSSDIISCQAAPTNSLAAIISTAGGRQASCADPLTSSAKASDSGGGILVPASHIVLASTESYSAGETSPVYISSTPILIPANHADHI